VLENADGRPEPWLTRREIGHSRRESNDVRDIVVNAFGREKWKTELLCCCLAAVQGELASLLPANEFLQTARCELGCLAHDPSARDFGFVRNLHYIVRAFQEPHLEAGDSPPREVLDTS
jgi:hypothetical protein